MHDNLSSLLANDLIKFMTMHEISGTRQQYLTAREYYTRAPFFPPISLVYDIYQLCRMLFFLIYRQFPRRNW